MYNFTLYMTTDCNFKCQYCYEDYHNHYQLNEKTLVDSLEFMMNYGDRGKVLIDFLGGEPLLKKDLIYKAVAYIKDNYPEREVKYYITTNCSMMDDRFIAFMKENHFTVRLSFDGNKETHDLNRVAKDGVSCYEKIFENIMKVKDSGLNFSVRMTVTENTIPYMFENICYLHEHGLDNICMIMDVYLKICDELKAEFEKQVGQILRYYLAEAAAGRVFTIDQFDGKMFNMLCDFGNCFGMCDAGIGNFKIFPNGQIYPCGFLTSNEKYCMSFSYTESNKKVFDRLNLKFEKGTLYGVHGKSGQGKSTLFKIITGVYQPTEGKVVVNNTDLQELDINSYWENTGYVMQRTQFFNDTVRRNMGLLHIVSEEEMDTVAKCLDLYDEIHTLEMVWDTEIKIDPCNFSEGQMRRLDIMRNILKNSQILIFDEATANIDEKRRGRFYQLLHALSREKIIIFSTHNLEELREADIIVDLEKLHIRQVSEK